MIDIQISKNNIKDIYIVSELRIIVPVNTTNWWQGRYICALLRAHKPCAITVGIACAFIRRNNRRWSGVGIKVYFMERD